MRYFKRFNSFLDGAQDSSKHFTNDQEAGGREGFFFFKLCTLIQKNSTIALAWLFRPAVFSSFSLLALPFSSLTLSCFYCLARVHLCWPRWTTSGKIQIWLYIRVISKHLVTRIASRDQRRDCSKSQNSGSLQKYLLHWRFPGAAPIIPKFGTSRSFPRASHPTKLINLGKMFLGSPVAVCRWEKVPEGHPSLQHCTDLSLTPHNPNGVLKTSKALTVWETTFFGPMEPRLNFLASILSIPPGKHGGGGIMLTEVFFSSWDLRLGRRFTFKHDNDLQRIAKMTQECHWGNPVKVLDRIALTRTQNLSIGPIYCKGMVHRWVAMQPTSCVKAQASHCTPQNGWERASILALLCCRSHLTVRRN